MDSKIKLILTNEFYNNSRYLEYLKLLRDERDCLDIIDYDDNDDLIL